MSNTTEKFFEDVFNAGHINFRCIKSGSRNIDANGLYNDHVIKILKQANEQNYEIYFVVNTGGYKDADIRQYNAVFIDLDCGKEENGEYFKLQEVDAYKQKKLEQLALFKHRPSYIVGTRNGLHVYWLLHSNVTDEQFKECEERLIAHFDADRKVKNPARLLRVPNYFWCKDSENKFMTAILQRTEVRYDVQSIVDSLPVISNSKDTQEGLCTTDKKEYKRDKIINDTKPPATHEEQHTTTTTNSKQSNKTLIQCRATDILQQRLDATSIMLNNHGEVYEYLKQQNLHQFLGVTGNVFNCIFHNDKNPSAGIVTGKETGHQIYVCQSDKCGVTGTIIQITERLTNLNRYKALQFLRQVFRIEYHETDWQKEQKEVLEENQRFMISDEFQQFYPEVYELIKNYIPQLYILNGFAKSKIVTERFTTPDGSPVFFASNSYIADMCKKDAKVMSDRIGLLTFLGLINKLQKHDLPDFLLRQAIHEAAKKKQMNIVNFYSIPSYGELLLSLSKDKAGVFRNKGFTMRGWSRELLFRTLGEEEANRVYPQMEGRELSDSSEKLARQIEKITMSFIEEKGWTTEKEVALSLETSISEQRKQRQMKRVIPELIDKYGLQKLRLNKELKNRFNVVADGYPFIITKAVLLEIANTDKKEKEGITSVITPKLKQSKTKINDKQG